MPLDEKTYDENQVLRSRTLTDYLVAGPQPGGEVNAKRDARASRSITVTFDGGQALATLSETEFDIPSVNPNAQTDPSYFAHLNAIRSKSHHFRNIPPYLGEFGSFDQIAGYFSSSTIATISENDFIYDENYKNNGIPSLLRESRVINPANNEVLAKTQTIYDNSIPASEPGAYSEESYGGIQNLNCPLNPQTSIQCWSKPANLYRGRPTSSKIWDNDNNQWIVSHTQFDVFGNAVKAKDAIDNEITTEYSPTYLYAYPTKITTSAPDPTGIHGTETTSSSETTYDLMTGLVLKTKNDFGQEIQTEYNDPMLRPTRVLGVGNYVIPITETIYDDTNLTVTVRKQIDETNWDEATTFLDTLGRTKKTIAKDSQGDIIVETEYDNFGKPIRVTNPYRNLDTVLWSKTTYDALQRPVESFAPAPAGQTGDSLGTTEYGISTAPGFIGTFVTTTDAAGKKSRAFSNALGQLVRVDEPDHLGGVEAVPQSTPDPGPTPTGTPEPPSCATGNPQTCLNGVGENYASLATYYKYNAQGKMVEVTQGQQKRFFLY